MLILTDEMILVRLWLGVESFAGVFNFRLSLVASALGVGFVIKESRGVLGDARRLYNFGCRSNGSREGINWQDRWLAQLFANTICDLCRHYLESVLCLYLFKVSAILDEHCIKKPEEPDEKRRGGNQQKNGEVLFCGGKQSDKKGGG